jgi:hypothetical protein
MTSENPARTRANRRVHELKMPRPTSARESIQHPSYGGALVAHFAGFVEDRMTSGMLSNNARSRFVPRKRSCSVAQQISMTARIDERTDTARSEGVE